MRGIKIIDIKLVETGSEVVTLAEAKAALHITGSDFDAELTALIKKARRYVENYCSISIIQKIIILIAEFYEEWELPYGPVREIVSVQTPTSREGSGPTQYQTVENWATDGDEFKTFNPASTNCSFSLSSTFKNRLRIVYTTGYEILPDDLKEGILNILVWMYTHRGDEGTGLPTEAIDKIVPYKRMTW